jgi:hypothetical protein
MLNRYWLSNTWPIRGALPTDFGLPGPAKAARLALAARQSVKLITKKYLLVIF